MDVDDARELVTGDRTELAQRWAEVVLLAIDDPEARAALRDLAPGLLEDEDTEGAHWVGLVLTVLDDEPFVAIEPASRTGLVGRMSGVVDNFQLHTLLMDAFDRVPEPIAAIARGDGPQQSDDTVVGAWNLYDRGALRDGRLPEDWRDTEHWIWNEGRPSDIPVFDNHRVILLGEPAYERTWNAARIFDPLPATLGARRLERGGVEEWLARIEGG